MSRILGCSLLTFAWCVSAAAGTIYVDADATGTGDGLTWVNAKTSVTAGVTAAQSGDEVWVAAATYFGTVTLKNGVAIIGGFNGTETLSSQSDSLANPTYLSGAGSSRVVASTDNDATAELRGLNIIRGKVSFPEYGAGLELCNSNATFIDCVFTRHKAGTLGGAVCNRGGSPTFVNCRFVHNDGMWAAGAIYNRDGGNPSFVNCLFAQNTAWEGGAIVSASGTPTFTNCTFVGNSATKSAGGAIFDMPGAAVLKNCIVWNNTAVEAGTDAFYNSAVLGGTTTATYSVIQDDDPNDANIYPGTGNIDDDPQFVYPAGDNYQLPSGSPAIDAGLSSDLPADTHDVDLDGDTTEQTPDSLRVARPLGVVDMGAFEDDGRNFYGDFVPKNRFISVAVDDPGEPTAVRVTLLHSGQFPTAEGRQWWVSVPFTVNDDGTTRHVARLGCTPVFHDWTGISVVHIGDAEVVPDGTYSIEALTLSAAETAGGSVCSQGAYEPALVVPTCSVWADVVGARSSPTVPWPLPDFVVFEDDDLAAVLDKFTGETDPSLIWADVDPQVPDLLVTIVDVSRVQDVVNGGTAYPFAAPAACATSGCSYGACCGASCSNTLQAGCSGTWISGEFCESSPDPCAGILGACCDARFGTCSQTTQSQCSGEWTGGVSCAPDPCGGSSSAMTGGPEVTDPAAPAAESDPYDIVPPALAALRQAAPLSQKRLADQLGKTKTWVQSVESGATRVGYTDLKAWCAACGTTLSQFIGDLAGL